MLYCQTQDADALRYRTHSQNGHILHAQAEFRTAYAVHTSSGREVPTRKVGAAGRIRINTAARAELYENIHRVYFGVPISCVTRSPPVDLRWNVT